MPFNFGSTLWENTHENFYRTHSFQPAKQEGPHCVSTALAILTQRQTATFLLLQKRGRLNTQEPVSWSEALRAFGMKLAYLPFDLRKLRFYMEELVGLDDLFLLCYYTGQGSSMLRDPDESGWVSGSHVVVLHRDLIIDPASGQTHHAFDHPCNDRHTKRLFRVVPAGHQRGL